MNIVVLSGKGGTGKTTVSTNLSKILGGKYIDCDVEEPNGFIFLKPNITETKEVKVIYPAIDSEKCTLCGECVKVCQFNALARTKKNILLFDKLCHSCGACELVCKHGAINWNVRKVGVIEEGEYDGLKCSRGIVNIGEHMAVPVIKKLLKNLDDELNIIDCSPGTSCNAVNTVKKGDFGILVTEPTEFGLHDLKLAVKLIRSFNIPFGIIINKYIEGESIITGYCEKENIKILGRLPYDRKVAEIYSSGKMLVDNNNYKEIFKNIGNEVKEMFSWN